MIITSKCWIARLTNIVSVSKLVWFGWFFILVSGCIYLPDKVAAELSAPDGVRANNYLIQTLENPKKASSKTN